MNQEGMTPEQKAGLMQLMGQTYGEAHKQDQMIIGQSGNLQPQSGQLKQQFEQVARTPTIAPQHQPGPPPQQPPPEQPAPPPPPVEVQQVSPEQAAREIAVAQQEPPRELTAVQDNDQMEFDLTEPSKVDKLFGLLEKQNLLLEEISLKLDNGKTVKGRKQK
tara:strand:- start:6755 stop:7240 length:486 start_codon:yes stop_codon:yes gene_type:complete